MNPEQLAPITKETAETRLYNFAGVIGSIFEGKVIDEALNLIRTIARQPIVLPSSDGCTCFFLSDDGTVCGNLTIAPDEPYEVSLTSARQPRSQLDRCLSSRSRY